MLTADPVHKPGRSMLILVLTVGLLGAGSQILRLLLRIPPHWQTITAFPIGLTEETLVSEPIFKALYDVTSLKPLDKASVAGMLFCACTAVQGLTVSNCISLRSDGRLIHKARVSMPGHRLHWTYWQPQDEVYEQKLPVLTLGLSA